LSATNPFGGVTAARGPVPGGYLMKTFPETTRASKVLPGDRRQGAVGGVLVVGDAVVVAVA
jgi:hypothetical protein